MGFGSSSKNVAGIRNPRDETPCTETHAEKDDHFAQKKIKKENAPGEVRTLDLQIMRLTLFRLSYRSILLVIFRLVDGACILVLRSSYP